MNSWPEDVLLIRYTELADSAKKRINLLIMISQLLNKPASFYTQEYLDLSYEDWNLLYTWIKQGASSYFWRGEADVIQTLHTCEKHIILDTHQMLTDIANVFGNHSSYYANTIDRIWTTARQYISTETKLEGE